MSEQLTLDLAGTARFGPDLQWVSSIDCGFDPDRRPAADFVVQGEEVHGVPGLVNLYRIDSPGLTASLAIAEQVSLLINRG